jgi:hypothetical protein
MISVLNQEDQQWLVAWLLRQSRQHQTLSKRAKRAQNLAEAERLADISVRLWLCATALTSQTEDIIPTRVGALKVTGRDHA